MNGTAVFDEKKIYRYSLTRDFLLGKGRVLFVMLNPSTATAEASDPTVRRCEGFARIWGYRTLEVVNAFAFRATYPVDLKKAADPVGPENDRHLADAAVRADKIVAAWGVHGAFKRRFEQVLKILAPFDVWCLGMTREGFPLHPLYQPNDAKLEPYTLGRSA